MIKQKYYLLENIKVIILENATKCLLNKKGIVVIQDLDSGNTARVLKSELKMGGILEDYFKQND